MTVDNIDCIINAILILKATHNAVFFLGRMLFFIVYTYRMIEKKRKVSLDMSIEDINHIILDINYQRSTFPS